ncbi:hypothetical protein SASC598O02_002460, partial [Snodgrassella alvi SCGC AB-598-O02]
LVECKVKQVGAGIGLIFISVASG